MRVAVVVADTLHLVLLLVLEVLAVVVLVGQQRVERQQPGQQT
jgi:hypothetical protein